MTDKMIKTIYPVTKAAYSTTRRTYAVPIIGIHPINTAATIRISIITIRGITVKIADMIATTRYINAAPKTNNEISIIRTDIAIPVQEPNVSPPLIKFQIPIKQVPHQKQHLGKPKKDMARIRRNTIAGDTTTSKKNRLTSMNRTANMINIIDGTTTTKKNRTANMASIINTTTDKQNRTASIIAVTTDKAVQDRPASMINITDGTTTNTKNKMDSIIIEGTTTNTKNKIPNIIIEDTMANITAEEIQPTMDSITAEARQPEMAINTKDKIANIINDMTTNKTNRIASIASITKMTSIIKAIIGSIDIKVIQ